MVAARWASAYSKASQNICNACTFLTVGVFFFFPSFLHTRSTEFQGHILPLLYTGFVRQQDLALRNRAVDARSLPELKVRSRFTVPVPGCVHAITGTTEHNHKHLLNKQLGSGPISMAPILLYRLSFKCF